MTGPRMRYRLRVDPRLATPAWGEAVVERWHEEAARYYPEEGVPRRGLSRQLLRLVTGELRCLETTQTEMRAALAFTSHWSILRHANRPDTGPGELERPSLPDGHTGGAWGVDTIGPVHPLVAGAVPRPAPGILSAWSRRVTPH
jgi:hypothetical protein